jgi:Leucine-rich repeat (LRR) protein
MHDAANRGSAAVALRLRDSALIGSAGHPGGGLASQLPTAARTVNRLSNVPLQRRVLRLGNGVATVAAVVGCLVARAVADAPNLSDSPLGFSSDPRQEALLMFHDVCGGDYWTPGNRWNTSLPICGQVGVGCGNVTTVSLPGANVSCSIGDVVRTLFSIPTLAVVQLSNNSVYGVVAESDVADVSCGNLHALDLCSNFIGGDGNSSWQWPRARHAEGKRVVAQRGLDGGVEFLLAWLASHCSQLKLLNVSVNNLAGSLPSFALLTNLTDLLLSANSLSGDLPAPLFGDDSTAAAARFLTLLDLSSNALSGTLPAELTALPSLARLIVDDNRLSGTLPSGLGMAQSLSYLSANTNRLSGTLPEEACAGGQLDRVLFKFNELSGTLPAKWGLCHKLRFVDVSYNRLIGTFPLSWTGLSALLFLSVESNELEGSIPYSFWSSASFLTWAFLSRNAFSGSVLNGVVMPSRGLPGLGIVELGFNNFTGVWPPAAARLNTSQPCTFVQLTLTGNRFSGGIPADFFEWCGVHLATLRVGSSGFSGSLPASISAATALRILDISDSALTGEVPALPPSLVSLSLQGNQLRLGGGAGLDVLLSLTSLQSVDVSRNPFSISAEQALYALGLAQYQLYNTAGAGSLRFLGMSGCGLHGVIPPILSAFYGCVVIDLSNNSLSGPLPLLGTFLRPRSVTPMILSVNRSFIRDEQSTLPMQWVSLDLSNNIGLVGPLPDQWSGFVSALQHLDVTGTGLRAGLDDSLLPSFLHVSSDESQLVAVPERNIQCPAITASGGVPVSIDPAYYHYSLCQCVASYYGVNGTCVKVCGCIAYAR